jgi:hypothetical protein
MLHFISEEAGHISGCKLVYAMLSEAFEHMSGCIDRVTSDDRLQIALTHDLLLIFESDTAAGERRLVDWSHNSSEASLRYAKYKT